MLDPIKATIITPGLDVSGKFAKTGIPASIVTKFLAEHGVIVEKTGLYSFFIMFTIGITKGRWNTLVTALQQFKDDYDKNQPLWRILPEFVAKHPRYERVGLRDLCQQIHDMYKANDVARRDHRDVPVGHAAGDEAVRRLRVHGAPRDRPRRDRRARGPRHQRAADALPAGHSAADSRASASTGRSSSTCSSRASFNERFPGFDTDIHGLVEEPDATGSAATTWTACGRSDRAGRCRRSAEPRRHQAVTLPATGAGAATARGRLDARLRGGDQRRQHAGRHPHFDRRRCARVRRSGRGRRAPGPRPGRR